MEGMTTKAKLLSQDDVDAILTQSGLEGSYEQNDEKGSQPEGKKIVQTKQRSKEEAKALSFRLYNKAFLERENGVSVIWNADEVMPMEAGMSFKILGEDYLTLGVLNEKHLIVGSTR